MDKDDVIKWIKENDKRLWIHGLSRSDAYHMELPEALRALVSYRLFNKLVRLYANHWHQGRGHKLRYGRPSYNRIQWRDLEKHIESIPGWKEMSPEEITRRIFEGYNKRFSVDSVYELLKMWGFAA